MFPQNPITAKTGALTTRGVVVADRYEIALQELVAQKQKGVTIRGKAPAAPATNVVKLMDALKKSLREGGSTERRKPTRDRAAAAKPSRPAARARKAG
jgi:DNA end-binding protein Ku